jgi:DNA (cytosine-5)-methyltransferase 1
MWVVVGMRILNLYAGIGGNRKLWGDEHEVVAVENVPEIAAIYKDLFPNDKVIIADAHKYLLEHFEEFDFIWSSPPCPSHSRMRLLRAEKGDMVKYPDMKLYEEIILLKFWFEGDWVVENVVSYYEPLIKPFVIDNHYFWSNRLLSGKKHDFRGIIRLGEIESII